MGLRRSGAHSRTASWTTEHRKQLPKHSKQYFYQSNRPIVQVFIAYIAMKLIVSRVSQTQIIRRQTQPNGAFSGVYINHFATLGNDQFTLRYQLRRHCANRWHRSAPPGCSGVDGAGGVAGADGAAAFAFG
jgi:hypothetical protein